VDLLNGNFQDKIDQLHLIDCRYPFEYQGGHIKSATNINQIADIQQSFFSNPVPDGEKVVIVFHCEYSIQRAPQMFDFNPKLIS
jgi:M-phase inducer phosphatase 1